MYLADDSAAFYFEWKFISSILLCPRLSPKGLKNRLKRLWIPERGGIAGSFPVRELSNDPAHVFPRQCFGNVVDNDEPRRHSVVADVTRAILFQSSLVEGLQRSPSHDCNKCPRSLTRHFIVHAHDHAIPQRRI